MGYEPYATAEYYLNTFHGNAIPDTKIERSLIQASRHIDSLTYNRIVSKGFSNLSVFQQEIVKEVVCVQAEFEYENKEELESLISSYSVNGVSMTIQPGWNLFADKGVAMQRSTYGLLEQTGLCCRSLGAI